MTWRISRVVLPVLIVLAAEAAWTENRVIGTVEATIDGIEGSWYVIASGTSPEDEKMTSMWMDRGSGMGLAIVSGFDSQTVTFRKRADGVGLEPVSGTVLAISFLFSRNESEHTIVFPTGPSDPSTVVFQPEAGNYQNLFALEEGELVVTKIESVDPGIYRFEGTFGGRLLPLQGVDSVEIANGSFVIEEVHLFEDE